jgi:hypothetical protein
MQYVAIEAEREGQSARNDHRRSTSRLVIPTYPPASDGALWGYICQGNTCSQPTRYPERLAYLLKTFERPQAAQNVSNTTEGKR